jgi:hypothetical protein
LISYLLDANVFIGAKNLHYGLDFCPAFWDWIVANNASGLVFSIEKVGDEVQALADELSLWAGARGPDFFLRPDAKVFPALAAVSIWATGQRYEPSAVSTFLQVADYYLVAQAFAGSIRSPVTRFPRRRRAGSKYPTHASASVSSV